MSWLEWDKMEWNWSRAEWNQVEQNWVAIVMIIKKGLESYVRICTKACSCSYINRTLYIDMLHLQSSTSTQILYISAWHSIFLPLKQGSKQVVEWEHDCRHIRCWNNPQTLYNLYMIAIITRILIGGAKSICIDAAAIHFPSKDLACRCKKIGICGSHGCDWRELIVQIAKLVCSQVILGRANHDVPTHIFPPCTLQLGVPFRLHSL